MDHSSENEELTDLEKKFFSYCTEFKYILNDIRKRALDNKASVELIKLFNTAIQDIDSLLEGNHEVDIYRTISDIFFYLEGGQWEKLGLDRDILDRLKNLARKIEETKDLYCLAKNNLTSNENSALSESLYKNALLTDGVIKSLHKEMSGRINDLDSQLKSKTLNIRVEKEDFHKQIGELESRIERLNESLNEKLESADNIVASIAKLASLSGTRVITASFGDKATLESRAAFWLRTLSIFCLLITGFILLWTWYENSVSVLTWKDFIVRTSAAIFWSIPAAYFAKESSRHRDAQRKYENFFLSHEAILSLLHELDASERKSIYTDLARQLSKSSTENGNTVAADPMLLEHQNKMFELMTKLIEVVKK